MIKRKLSSTTCTYQQEIRGSSTCIYNIIAILKRFSYNINCFVQSEREPSAQLFPC